MAMVICTCPARLRTTPAWTIAVLVLVCLVLPCRSRPTAAQVTTGVIETTVGGYNGDGGPATNAVVDPRGMAVCSRVPSGPADLYIADAKGKRLRKVDGVTGAM